MGCGCSAVRLFGCSELWPFFQSFGKVGRRGRSSRIHRTNAGWRLYDCGIFFNRLWQWRFFRVCLKMGKKIQKKMCNFAVGELMPPLTIKFGCPFSTKPPEKMRWLSLLSPASHHVPTFFFAIKWLVY